MVHSESEQQLYLQMIKKAEELRALMLQKQELSWRSPKTNYLCKRYRVEMFRFRGNISQLVSYKLSSHE